jgi:hypothetical protein
VGIKHAFVNEAHECKEKVISLCNEGLATYAAIMKVADASCMHGLSSSVAHFTYIIILHCYIVTLPALNPKP